MERFFPASKMVVAIACAAIMACAVMMGSCSDGSRAIHDDARDHGASQYDQVVGWLNENLAGCMDENSKIKWLYSKSDAESIFSVGPAVPSYVIQDGRVTEIQEDRFYPIYSSGFPIAWAIIYAEEQRSQADVDGYVNRVLPLEESEIECLSRHLPCAKVQIREPFMVKVDGAEYDIGEYNWMLDSQGDWYFVPPSSHLPFNLSGQQVEELSKEGYDVFESRVKPLDLGHDVIASIDLSSDSPERKLDIRYPGQ